MGHPDAIANTTEFEGITDMLHATITDSDHKSRVHLVTGTLMLAGTFALVMILLRFMLV
jgi:hypothetical protein